MHVQPVRVVYTVLLNMLQIPRMDPKHWAKQRSTIRRSTVVAENVRKSLQPCKPENNRTRLVSLLKSTSGIKATEKLYGLLAVLDELEAETKNGYWGGCIRFDDGYEIYSSFTESAPEREAFRDSLLHPTHGLCVCLFTNPWNGVRHIVLENGQTDIAHMLTTISTSPPSAVGSQARRVDRFQLDGDIVHALLNSMDTAYDRKVARSVLAANRSRAEIYKLGMKPTRTVKSLKEVSEAVDQIQTAKRRARNIVKERLTNKVESLKKEIADVQRVIETKTPVWSKARIGDLHEKIDVLTERQKQVEETLKQDKTFQTAVKRTADDLIETSRVKRRKLGAGPKAKIDSEDEEFIARAIEDKSTAHGRRHDMVLYTGMHRVKKSDMLSLANFRKMQQGKQLIKSATTVYNRSRPRSQRSLQAQNTQGKRSVLLQETTENRIWG